MTGDHDAPRSPPRAAGSMVASPAAPPGLADALAYPFFQTVFDRKSRRVGLGMEVGSDVLAYRSPYEPVPLGELRRRCCAWPAPA